jgi:DNA-binding beta-propeller fold protein YncE
MANRQSVLGAIALVSLAACASAGTRAAPPIVPIGSAPQGALERALFVAASPAPNGSANAGPGWLTAEATLGNYLIYVANGRQVTLFPKQGFNRPPVGELTGGVGSAYGLFLARDKDLYVTNWLNDNVTVYPRGATEPKITYAEQLSRPLYSVADAQNVYVGNANNGKIIVFEKGNTKPIGSLTTFGVEVDGLAFDKAGDLYAAYRRSDDRDDGGIEFFRPPASQGTDLGINVTAPQGVVVDDAGNVLIVETEGANRVDIFPPGATTPSAVALVPTTPTQIQLGRRDRMLYISALSRDVYVTRYPGPAKVELKIHNSLSEVQGLAVSPPGELHR